MPTTIERYISKCLEVFRAKPSYKNGASTLKECDCIGMDKYAFRECGVKFSTTGTNYSYRNQITAKKRIGSVDDLTPGAAVFRARSPGDKGYDLPAKYRPGGKGYTGDLIDYYHIGTVISTDPVQIVHMTSPTAKQDTDWKKWDYVGEWKPAYISDYPGDFFEDLEPGEPGETPDTECPVMARVFAASGKSVNLRKSPSFGSALLERVPIGEQVEVLEDGKEWDKVGYKNLIGYILKAFLIVEGQEKIYTVTISGLTMAQVDELRGMYKDLETTVTKE